MPLNAVEAKRLIRRLIDEGRFVSPGSGSHARKEMDKDGISDLDAVNVLRGERFEKQSGRTAPDGTGSKRRGW